MRSEDTGMKQKGGLAWMWNEECGRARGTWKGVGVERGHGEVRAFSSITAEELRAPSRDGASSFKLQVLEQRSTSLWFVFQCLTHGRRQVKRLEGERRRCACGCECEGFVQAIVPLPSPSLSFPSVLCLVNIIVPSVVGVACRTIAVADLKASEYQTIAKPA